MYSPPSSKHLQLAIFFSLLLIQLTSQTRPSYHINSVINLPGLASSEINTVGQDGEGFIWVGTNIGISRFDGYTFKNYNSIGQHRIQKVSAMCQSQGGRLYFGGTGGLFYVDQGKLFEIPLPAGQADILSIHSTADGLWIGGQNLSPTFLSNTFLRQPTDSVVPFFSETEWKAEADDQAVYGLASDPVGNLYIGTLNRVLQYDGQRLRTLWADDSQPLYIRSIIAQTPNRIYWGGMKSSLRLMRAPGYEIQVDYFLVNAIETEQGIYALLNNIYAETTSGFKAIVDLNRFRDSWYQCFIQDQEGNFWIGAHSDLLKISPSPFRVYDAQTHPDMDQLYSVHSSPSGDLLLGGHRGRIHQFKAGEFSRLLPNDQRVVPIAEILAIHSDSQGQVWFGSAYEGLVRLHNGELEGFTDANGLGDNACYFIHESAEGILWVGGDYSISKIHTKENQEVSITSFRANDYDQVAPRYYDGITDPSGNLWAGSSLGLFKISDQEVEIQSFPPHLPTNPFISGIQQDQMGQVWIATQGDGLWQGQFNPAGKLEITKRWQAQDGLEADSWQGLHVDQKNRVWVASNQQICCVDPGNKPSTFCFDKKDGWPIFSPRYIRFHESADSNVWIVGQDALIQFSPYSIPLNRVAPRAIIEKVELLGTEESIFDFSEENEQENRLAHHVRLPHNRNFLRFEFTSTSYTNPGKNRFQYRLVGAEKEWQNIGENGSHSVSYPKLLPGPYTFEVQAANNHGIWSQSPATFSFTILPPFWQTNLAYMVYLGLLLGVLWLARRQVIRRETLKSQLRVEQLEKEKAQEIDQIRSRFFANISHEFRTPLTLIKAPLEDLLTSKKNDEERLAFLSMHQNTERLLELVNQLLDLSKLEAGVMQIQTEILDIYLLLRQLVGSFESLAQQKGMQIQLEIPNAPLHLAVDRDKFEKIILNLVSNAVKFSPQDGWIKVVAEYQQKLCIKVGNNSQQIPSSQLQQLFDRFYQVEGTRHQGAGIGLALVKELVELQGGKVGVRSSPEATWFTVELPLQTASEAQKSILPLPKSASHELVVPSAPSAHRTPAVTELLTNKPEVLLVEDHAEVRAYLVDKLRPYFKIAEAEDGQVGWDQAIQKLPDLIISDVMMPVMDGVSLCNKIKGDHRTDHIPVILLTAKADVESRITGLKSGADDYLAKPFNSEALIIRCQNLIQQREILRMRFGQNLQHAIASEAATSAEAKFLKKAIGIVEAHLADADFSIAQFAHEILLSRTQLHRKLKALTDMNATDFVRNIRLEKAAKLLRQQSGTVSEIAYQVGFNNLSYFTRCFKRKYGKVPSQFS